MKSIVWESNPMAEFVSTVDKVHYFISCVLVSLCLITYTSHLTHPIEGYNCVYFLQCANFMSNCMIINAPG